MVKKLLMSFIFTYDSLTTCLYIASLGWSHSSLNHHVLVLAPFVRNIKKLLKLQIKGLNIKEKTKEAYIFNMRKQKRHISLTFFRGRSTLVED